MLLLLLLGTDDGVMDDGAFKPCDRANSFRTAVLLQNARHYPLICLYLGEQANMAVTIHLQSSGLALRPLSCDVAHSNQAANSASLTYCHFSKHRQRQNHRAQGGFSGVSAVAAAAAGAKTQTETKKERWSHFRAKVVLQVTDASQKVSWGLMDFPFSRSTASPQIQTETERK